MSVTGRTEAESAKWRLAERLYEKMEHLEQGGMPPWEDLTEQEQNLFYFSIKAVLLERKDVLLALEINDPGDDVVARCRGSRK